MTHSSDPPGVAPSAWTSATIAATITCTGLIAHQVAGKAVRDALFLSSFPAASLPLVMGAAAALSLGAILWLSRAMVRHSPAQLLPKLFAASALGLAVEWGVGLFSPSISVVAVYLHMTAVGPALISLFWSLINERYDPHLARPVFARIAAGGTFGGLLGALAVVGASTFVDPPLLLLFLAALHAACAGERCSFAPRPSLLPWGPLPHGLSRARVHGRTVWEKMKRRD